MDRISTFYAPLRTVPVALVLMMAAALELSAQPNAVIIGVDWGRRQVTSYNECTKNRSINEYDGLVTVLNDGNQSLKIESLELVGPDADAGYFALDDIDPATTIEKGTVIRPAEQGDTHKVHQLVLFRPKEVRSYECAVVITLSGGSTTGGILTGIGADAQGTFEGIVLDTLDFHGTSLRDTILLRSSGGVRLDVTGLWISGGDSTAITFEPGFALPNPGMPWRLDPDSAMRIPVLFTPGSLGLKKTRITFTGSHSRCFDSTSEISAFKHLTAGVENGRSISARFASSPNPFSSGAAITVDLEHPSQVLLAVYDASGREVERLMEGRMEAGHHERRWEGAGFPAGLYFCRLTVDDATETKGMILTR